MDELARIAYESSLRRLDHQAQLLRDIRSRTGLLLAASSVTASVLGRPALEQDRSGPALLALLAFVISVAASVYVLVPNEELVFAMAGSNLYEQLYELRDDTEEVYRRLTHDVDRFWRHNEVELQPRVRAFEVAAAALAAEMLFLLVATADIMA